jgi:hypothetical protein
MTKWICQLFPVVCSKMALRSNSLTMQCRVKAVAADVNYTAAAVRSERRINYASKSRMLPLCVLGRHGIAVTAAAVQTAIS